MKRAYEGAASSSSRPAKRSRARRALVPAYRRLRPSPELKTFDTVYVVPAANLTTAAAATYSAPTVAFTGFSCANLVQEGAQYYARVGSKINIRRVEFTGNFNITDTPCNVAVRILLVYDKSPNGAAPGIGDMIYQAPTAAVGFGSVVATPNKSRFYIFADKRFTVDTSGASIRTIRIRKKVNFNSNYDGTANPLPIANVREGAVFVVVFEESGAAHADILSMNTRIHYFDY